MPMSYVTPRLCGPRHPSPLPEPGLCSPANSVPTLQAPACDSQCRVKPRASLEGTEPRTRKPGSGPGPACCRVRAGTAHVAMALGLSRERQICYLPGPWGHPDNRSWASEEAGPIPVIVTPVTHAHVGNGFLHFAPAFSLVMKETRIQTGMMTSVCMTGCSVLPPLPCVTSPEAPTPIPAQGTGGPGVTQHTAPAGTCRTRPVIPHPLGFPLSITHYISVSPATQISIWPSSLILIVVNPKAECVIKNLIETNSSHVSPPPKYSYQLDGALVI